MIRNPKLIENLTNEQLNNIQIKLLKNRDPLCLDKIDRDKISTKSHYLGLNDILYYNRHLNTLYSSSKRLQCFKNRNRSQGDLYMLMRYYYPDITFKEFRKALIRLLNNYHISTFYCNDIHKRIFYNPGFFGRKPYHSNILDHLYKKDEFGFTLSKFSDGKDYDDSYDDYTIIIDYSPIFEEHGNY